MADDFNYTAIERVEDESSQEDDSSDRFNTVELLEEYRNLNQESNTESLCHNEPETLLLDAEKLYCSVLGDRMELTGRPLAPAMTTHELLTNIIGPNARSEVRTGGQLSGNTLVEMRRYMYDLQETIGGFPYQPTSWRAGWMQDQLGPGFHVEVTPQGNERTSQEGIIIYYNNRQVGRVLRP